MRRSVLQRAASLAAGSELLPLMPGDHLDRATFHRRYAEMQEGLKAELVGGVVYTAPLFVPHGTTSLQVAVWLGAYQSETPGLQALGNTTVLLGDDGEPQPDACLIIDEQCGGQTRIDDGCLVGAPELVVEVAYSSDAYDLHSKKREYEQAGVREYVVVSLREGCVYWFVLRGELFEEVAAGEDGLLRSEVFPGLWLDPAALVRGDIRAVRSALEGGMAAAEHAEFVERLSQAAKAD